MNPKMKILRKKAMSLPLLPGVYIMKNADGEIIYIGKAKALKNRVSQYFGSQNRHPVKVRKMVENVDRFDYIVTGSEFEALVLECSLIKQHSPKYNILLKDDKGYSYIRISEGEYRKISAVFNNSAKPDSTSLTSSSTACSSSGPPAMILIFVPPIMPSERTPRRLFALTLLSSFSTQIEDLNSLAF